MASLEDYDEFGNYIGADLASDDEDEDMQPAFAQQQPAALEGYEEETEPVSEGALMQIDGQYFRAREILVS